MAEGELSVWASRYAGSEGPDAAVKSAWDEETDVDTLCDLIANVPPTMVPGLPDPWMGYAEYTDQLMMHRGWMHDGCTCLPSDETLPWQSCAVCCHLIRKGVPCPTWAELTGEKP